MLRNKIVFLVLISSFCFAQQSRFKAYLDTEYQFSSQINRSAFAIELFSESQNRNKRTKAFKSNNSAKYLNIDERQAKRIYTNNSDFIILKLPEINGNEAFLKLVKVENKGGFEVFNAQNKDIGIRSKAIHYQGLVNGKDFTRAAVTIFENGETLIFTQDSKSEKTLGKLDNSTQYIYYDNKNLPLDIKLNCFLDSSFDEQIKEESIRNQRTSTSVSSTCKTLKVYMEADYNLFQKKGSSIQSTINYLSAVFNQVAMLYHNESIKIAIAAIKVWDTNDPYASINDTKVLNTSFRANTLANYPGDIALFLSGRSYDLGGGIAYHIPTDICNKANQFCSMAIFPTFENVPTYSWTVNVIAHEMGHILGSRHTHWCGWSGGPIDGCSGIAEDGPSGPCGTGPIPPNGGTIMSYCHLNATGIDFTLGFGPQPGNVIRNNIAAANCLTSQIPTQAPNNLNITNLKGNQIDLNWNSVPNTSFYSVEYKPTNGAGWLFAGTTTLTTFHLKNLDYSTNYEWRIKVDCSPYSNQETFITPSYFLEINEPIVNSILCKEMFFIIPYSAENFMVGNTFYLELSDANGNFNQPTIIASDYSHISGVFSANIPSNLPNGLNYKLRVTSTNPAKISLETAAFQISGHSPLNFLVNNMLNPSNDSYRVFTAANQSATNYYEVNFNPSIIPSASQIINKLTANNSTPLKAGSMKLPKATTTYSKIIGNLLPQENYIVYSTLDNISDCPNPIMAKNITTTGTKVSHCSPIMDCTDNDFINNFICPTLGINHTNSGCNNGGYSTFYNYIGETLQGQIHPFTINTGYFSQNLIIWLDANNNGIFESTETIYENSNSLNTHASSLVFPTNLEQGIYKLRIKVSAQDSERTNPCDDRGIYGEIEDYYIKINKCASPKSLISTVNDVENGLGKIVNAETINAQNKVYTNSASDFNASKSILLNPGFETESGSIFNAIIDENCGY